MDRNFTSQRLAHIITKYEWESGEGWWEVNSTSEMDFLYKRQTNFIYHNCISLSLNIYTRTLVFSTKHEKREQLLYITIMIIIISHIT